MIVIGQEIQTAAYLFASILFILSLGGLASQESAKRGVLFGIVGMIIAIIATVLGEGVEGQVYIIGAIAIASLIGIIVCTNYHYYICTWHIFINLVHFQNNIVRNICFC